MAVIAPTATVPYIACAVAASAGGTIADSICMQARCNKANVRPCSGSTSAIAGSQAVTAVTLQRTTPALAASAAAPAGPSHLNSVGPTTTKTTTSARTPSDPNSPAVP